MFGFTFAGVVLAYIFIQGIGIAAGDVVSEQTAEGVRLVMGGGLLGGLAVVLLGLAAVWATGLLALAAARPGVLVPARRPSRLTPSPVAVVLEPRFPEPRPVGAWSLEAESPEP